MVESNNAVSRSLTADADTIISDNPPHLKRQKSISSANTKGDVLIIVENLPVPFDRRVWQEANALREAGYGVSVICPKGKGHNKSYEEIAGIHIYRHSQPFEASGAKGYLLEYSWALFWEMLLAIKVLRKHGFDVIHACNPPDLIFLVAAFFKVFFGKKFIFDQHDLNPELFEVKFRKKGFLHKMLQRFERWTFWWADASLATNETFKDIAVSRGNMKRDDVWVVKSYPDLNRFKRIEAKSALERDFKYIAGYIGIMGNQDGIDYLVDAMDYIVNDLKRDDIGCIIIGDGPELDTLVARAKERNLEEYVKFTGYLSGDPMLANLSALDIGIIPDPPNACNDKLSMNKVFEYSILGIPFVQFDLSQARKEARNASLVVDDVSGKGLAKGMIELFEDMPRREKMSAYGRQYADQDFKWENEKKSLLEAYATVLS